MTHFRLARTILLVGFLLNVLFCVVAAYGFDQSYPFTTFLFRPDDRFQDLFAVLRATVDLDPYRLRPVMSVPGHEGVEVSNYFPLTHILFYPLARMDQNHALLIYLGLGSVLFIMAYLRVSARLGVPSMERFWSGLVFVPMCYPILFTLDRGNIDVFVFLAVALGIAQVERGHERLGAMAIGFAGAIKLFPLMFLWPLIKKKRYAAVLTAVAFFLVTTFASASLFSGDLASNLIGLKDALTTFKGFLLHYVNGVTHSINFFSMGLAIATYWNQAYFDPNEVEPFLTAYNALSLVILLGVLAFVWRSRAPSWVTWTLLAAAFQVLPFPSYDYRLLYSLIPLTFVLLDERIPSRFVWVISLILVQKPIPLYNDVRWSVLINPLLLTVLAFMAMRVPLEQVAKINSRDR